MCSFNIADKNNQNIDHHRLSFVQFLDRIEKSTRDNVFQVTHRDPSQNLTLNVPSNVRVQAFGHHKLYTHV